MLSRLSLLVCWLSGTRMHTRGRRCFPRPEIDDAPINGPRQADGSGRRLAPQASVHDVITSAPWATPGNTHGLLRLRFKSCMVHS